MFPALTISDSANTHNPAFTPEKVFISTCELQLARSYYLSNDGGYFVVDVGLKVVVNSVSLRNTHNSGSYDRYSTLVIFTYLLNLKETTFACFFISKVTGANLTFALIPSKSIAYLLPF